MKNEARGAREQNCLGSEDATSQGDKKNGREMPHRAEVTMLRFRDL